jgi:hypothetical protein
MKWIRKQIFIEYARTIAYSLNIATILLAEKKQNRRKIPRSRFLGLPRFLFSPKGIADNISDSLSVSLLTRNLLIQYS